MGLGKTIQALSFLYSVKTNPVYTDSPILIVGPVSLLETSWYQDGFEKFITKETLSKF
ncbi:MAG: SNF2 family DNA or RNA helicase [Bacteriovoracaceae bacterium]|jgi:SNF2 family DNA or RNA helicase